MTGRVALPSSSKPWETLCPLTVCLRAWRRTVRFSAGGGASPFPLRRAAVAGSGRVAVDLGQFDRGLNDGGRPGGEEEGAVGAHAPAIAQEHAAVGTAGKQRPAALGAVVRRGAEIRKALAVPALSVRTKDKGEHAVHPVLHGWGLQRPLCPKPIITKL